MAQWSLGWTTNGTGDGISGGYTQSKFTQMLEAWWTVDPVNQGVLQNYLNELEVTASGGSASPVSIDTGAGMVKGFYYTNETVGTKDIPTPAGSTRVDRIVLRADWGSQVVRFQRVAGTEGLGAPDLTQTDETTWEISLATVSITTGGVATVTDARTYVHPAIEVETAMIQAGAVTATKIGADAVLSTKIADDAVGSAHIAANSILTANIVDAQVTAAKIANRTRSFFVSPSYVKNDDTDDLAYYSLTYQGWLMSNATAFAARGMFSVPDDFASGMSVQCIWGPQAWSDLIYLSYGATYGAPRQNYNVHAYSTAAQVSSAGSGAEVSWRTGKPTFSMGSAAIGDIVHLDCTRNTGASDTSSDDVHFQGWKISYTADG